MTGDVSIIAPLLPLESFRQILGYHPYHFWQWADNNIIPVTSSCNDIVYQYPWQSADRVGRNEIIEAIINAEHLLAEQIGYWPAPRFITEIVPWPKYNDKAVWNMSHADVQGRWQNVRMKWGYIHNIGLEVRTLIATSAVTYTDTDGDGLVDTATASAATVVTDTEQIAVYFAAANRLTGDPAVSERYRIAPVRVSISGGTVTVRIPAWILAKPALYEGVAPADLDPTDTTVPMPYVTNVEIYQLYADPTGTTYDTSQAALIWETAPYPEWAVCCDCAGGVIDASTDPATIAYGVARAGIRASKEGIVGVGSAAYDRTNDIWRAVSWGACRPPERVLVRYRAGYPLTNNQMDKAYQVAVARLAAAELARPICACDEANRELYRWQFDLARTGGSNDESYTAVSAADLDNPFGTRRGHVYAWRFVNDRRNLIGFSI